MPLQWRNQIWQSLEEGAGKRCSEVPESDATLRASLSGTFLQRKDVVNQCLESGADAAWFIVGWLSDRLSGW